MKLRRKTKARKKPGPPDSAMPMSWHEWEHRHDFDRKDHTPPVGFYGSEFQPTNQPNQ